MQEQEGKKEHTWSVVASTTAQLGRAEELGKKLGLPVLSSSHYQGACIMVAEDSLSAWLPDEHGQTLRLQIDFTTPAWQRRIARVGNEPLIRAMGRKNRGNNLHLVDATAGLGRDSFLLAAAGFQVQAYEQEPLLAALLADGLARAARHPATRAIAERITLHCADACQALRATRPAPDIIYIDPMFPPGKKSAKVKKNLQLIRAIANRNQDSVALFNAAWQCAPGRLVVKRPHKGDLLTEHAASYAVDGPTIRFDIYLR